MLVSRIFGSEIKSRKSHNANDHRVVKNQPQYDTVAFSGAEKTLALFNKYGITPKEIKVLSNIKLDDKVKELLLKKLLKAHEHAKANVEAGNITKTGYATNIGFVNGIWGGVATNYNDTSLTSICGERSAVVMAYNKLLKKLAKSNSLEKFDKELNAKYVVMSSAKAIGEDKFAASPCADCLGWFNSDKVFRDDTQIIFFDKDELGNLALNSRTVKEILPLRREKDSLFTKSINIDSITPDISDSAKKSMKEKKISTNEIKTLIKRAKEVREKNCHTDEYSGLNIAASVMADSKKITTESKFDWSKRWVDDPAEKAAKSLVKQQGKNTKINAIAYYGNGTFEDNKGILHTESVVKPQTLGRIKGKHGDGSTIIISVVDNKIKVRTIDDYIPSEYAYVTKVIKK